MRFWDSSAIVPLIVREPSSADARALLREDERMLVWWATPVECGSALRRLERRQAIATPDLAVALQMLTSLGTSWSEILPAHPVRIHAQRLLAVHPLRAADALQLAAALVWRGQDAAGADFVCLDDRLRDAAAREQFSVLPRA
ncbi:MAG: type II toxin-antitoxin system VapC family toxin [Solirubrobacteraceae bacterium]